MFKNFKKYIYGSIGLDSGSLVPYIKNITDKLFETKRKSNRNLVLKVNLKKVLPKRFYLIQYNFNGNKIWCPILALDYKVKDNKNILYALNLEYLPPRYKIIYFDLLFSKLEQPLNKISNATDLTQELPLPISFELIYKTLKTNGNMNYAITAFDYLKIKQAFLISIKMAPEIIMCDLKRYNSKNMKSLLKTLPNSEEKNNLEDIIEKYDKLIEEYQEDSILYHKQVANFEKHLKLMN